MGEVQIKELLEAGAHLGHQRKKWNPKMQPYIYGDKNGICIINLVKTSELLEKACQFLKESALQKKNIVFVGTKRHISEIVKEEAIKCGAFFINRRWLGGLLTNFDTIRQRLNRLRELEEMQESGTLAHSNKKELAVFNKELEKLQRTLGGIKNMRGKLDILVVIDGQEEQIAIKEAQKTNVTVVAVIDTNCDPKGIDYPIPANDDSIRSVKLILSTIANSIIEGREGQIPDVHKTSTPKNSFSKRALNIKQSLKQSADLTQEAPVTTQVQEITIPQEVQQ
ncbi:MAG: 30S ribosomal protein S2 [Candidatus Melainabacteria bacterium]|nr:30S ribosomal protein S2 [Candidatus Melainabacteria bacterium]